MTRFSDSESAYRGSGNSNKACVCKGIRDTCPLVTGLCQRLVNKNGLAGAWVN
jgi:hypothetical protein